VGFEQSVRDQLVASEASSEDSSSRRELQSANSSSNASGSTDYQAFNFYSEKNFRFYEDYVEALNFSEFVEPLNVFEHGIDKISLVFKSDSERELIEAEMMSPQLSDKFR